MIELKDFRRVHSTREGHGIVAADHDGLTWIIFVQFVPDEESGRRTKKGGYWRSVGRAISTCGHYWSSETLTACMTIEANRMANTQWTPPVRRATAA